MAPTKNEIDSVWQFESTSMIPVVGAVLATLLVLFALVWASISICACCEKGGDTRRKRFQDEADAAVPPPPEPRSRSTNRDVLVFDLPSGSYMLRRKGEEEPQRSGTGATSATTTAADADSKTRKKEKKKKEKGATKAASPTNLPAEKEKLPPTPPKKEIATKEATTTIQAKSTQVQTKKAAVGDEHQTYVPEDNVQAYRTLAAVDSMAIFGKAAAPPDKHQTYVSDDNVHAYRTIGGVDSAAVFGDDKSRNRGYRTGRTIPRNTGLDPSMKFVDDENVARYKTLNLVDSKIFDKAKDVKVEKIEPEKTKTEDKPIMTKPEDKKPIWIEEKSKTKSAEVVVTDVNDDQYPYWSLSHVSEPLEEATACPSPQVK